MPDHEVVAFDEVEEDEDEDYYYVEVEESV